MAPPSSRWRWASALYELPRAISAASSWRCTALSWRSAPSAVNPSSRRSSEMIAVPMWPRSFVSTLIPTPQPPCSGPSRRSAGSWTSVKNTSSNSAPPVICRSGRISMPGRSIGHRKNEMPSCLAASGLVRAMRMPQSLIRPPEHHTFWPLTTKWSPSRSAFVDSPPRSLPAPGSENSWHHTWSPRSVARQVLGLLLGRAVHEDGARRPAPGRPCSAPAAPTPWRTRSATPPGAPGVRP